MNHSIYITEPDFIRLREALSKMSLSASVNYVAESLRNTLHSAKRVPPENILPDVVTMNTEVELMDLSNNRTVNITVTYPDNVDLAKRKISVLTPAGEAIFAKKVGEKVQWLTPTGLKIFRLEKINYQPESAGDFHL